MRVMPVSSPHACLVEELGRVGNAGVPMRVIAAWCHAVGSDSPCSSVSCAHLQC